MPGDAWALFKERFPGLAAVKLEQTAARKAGKPVPHPELAERVYTHSAKPKKKKKTKSK